MPNLVNQMVSRQLEKEIGEVDSMLVVSLDGLTVAETEVFRGDLAKSGVRLRMLRNKLARRVLRRHRLIELFLVEVMGMDWSEVHSEAEILEHAVSDRLIDRMDEMLGRPTVDPHGDPIPTAGGKVGV